MNRRKQKAVFQVIGLDQSNLDDRVNVPYHWLAVSVIPIWLHRYKSLEEVQKLLGVVLRWHMHPHFWFSPFTLISSGHLSCISFTLVLSGFWLFARWQISEIMLCIMRFRYINAPDYSTAYVYFNWSSSYRQNSKICSGNWKFSYMSFNGTNSAVLRS